MKSLDNLLLYSSCKNIVIVAGGPSLDYCMGEIEELVSEDTIFLLTDVVCEKFIGLYPESKRIIFTVESRTHNYLRSLRNERIACYVGANKTNYYPDLNECYHFHFDLDEGVYNGTFEMKSPGTVSGAAIYWALYTAINNLNSNLIGNRIVLLGLDLYYIDNQVYNRLAKFNIYHDYWTNRETREWEAVLRRTSDLNYIGGYAVRTSHEFQRTRENLNLLINKCYGDIEIWDYSPLGVSQNFVKKVTPKKIISE